MIPVVYHRRFPFGEDSQEQLFLEYSLQRIYVIYMYTIYKSKSQTE